MLWGLGALCRRLQRVRRYVSPEEEGKLVPLLLGLHVPFENFVTFEPCTKSFDWLSMAIDTLDPHDKQLELG